VCGSDKKVKAIAAGHSHSAAITEEGHVYMWGLKAYLEPHRFKVRGLVV
jgi:alpha-tubulin suppressor-like RCC1 family protein